MLHGKLILSVFFFSLLTAFPSTVKTESIGLFGACLLELIVCYIHTIWIICFTAIGLDIYLFIYLFISALTLTTPATQIKTTKCQLRIERLQKEH